MKQDPQPPTIDQPQLAQPETLDATRTDYSSVPEGVGASTTPDSSALPSLSYCSSVTQGVGASPDAPVIAGYHITRMIAEGGMGRVYEGRDLTLDREVAIKTLQPGMNPERFVTEAKITARLPHPGVPPVHALGTLVDGSYYLVMKLIRGETLAHALRLRASPKDDLPRFVQIFEQIAQAVGFAHAQGILHRDLKPLNVMVGAFGEVQVMDWGLAKDTASRESDGTGFVASGDDTQHTQSGAVMGTPGYMAPEQARGETVDARADVFALGSILAALLTGNPAFRSGEVTDVIARTARAETGDVLARLDDCDADAELVGLARRCLEARPEDRPADAQIVAAEVADYRAGVEQRLRQAETEAAEALVRVSEQRKRRRVLQVAGGLIAGVLLLGIAGTTVGLIQAQAAAEKERDAKIFAQGETKRAEDAAGRERDARVFAQGETKKAEVAAGKEQQARKQADQEKNIALAVRDFLQTRLIRQANPFEHSRWAFGGTGRESGTGASRPAGRDLTVRELLERATQEFSPESIEKKFPGQPLVQAEILETIGETYEGMREHTKAVRFVEAAQATRDKHLGAMHLAALIGQTNLVFSYLAASRPVDSVKAMSTLGTRLEALLPELPEDPTQARDHPALVKLDAILRRIEERFDPHSFVYPKVEMNIIDGAWVALQMPGILTRIVRIKESLILRFGKDDRRTLLVEIWAAFGHHAMGQTRKACEMYEGILARAEKKLRPEDRVLDGLREVLVETYSELGIKQSESIRLLDDGYQSRLRAVGPSHPNTLSMQSKLAMKYQEAGKGLKAIEIFEKVRDSELKTLGPEHPDTLSTLHNLAEMYSTAGKIPQAIEIHEKVRVARLKVLGPEHPNTITTFFNLALAYFKVGKGYQAIELFEKVRDSDLKTFGPEHPDTLTTLYYLARSYHQSSRLSQAIELYENVLDRRIKKPGLEHPETLDTQFWLAKAYQDFGKQPQAIELYEKNRDARVKVLGPEHPDTLTTMHNLAFGYDRNGKVMEAIDLYEKVLPLRIKVLGADHSATLITLRNLALLYQQSNKLPQAIELYEKVRDIQVKKFGLDHPDTLSTLNTLVGVYKRAGKRSQVIDVYEKVRDVRVSKLGLDNSSTHFALKNLGEAYCEAGQGDKALPVFQQLLAGQRKLSGKDNPLFAELLAQVSLQLQRCQQFAPTEEMLRECLAIREKTQPSAWSLFNSQSLLGGALLGQKKLTEAEPLLLKGYEGMKEREQLIPLLARERLSEAVDRLIALYEAMNKPDEVAKWRKEREKYPAPKPATPR